MEISLVVPVFIPTEKHLAMSVKCLELARAKTKLPYELIIIETCSDYLKDYADVHIYEKERTDVHKSVNKGLKVASGEYVALLTNDVFVDTAWLECLKETFLQEDCGISTLASSEFNHQKEDKIEEAFWFSVVMISRKLINKIGYFDEDYKRIFADTDYAVRAYKAGFKMYRNYGCVVNHTPGSTVYAEDGHGKAFEEGRKLFNEKHKGCELPIFNRLR